MIGNMEEIILVDDNGKEIGIAEKLSSHHAKTPLHLAFSCYIFNDKGELLVTRRALKKKVWPGVWTNSVCGHIAPGETTLDAIKRRLQYELGMTAKDFKVVLPDYRYKTPPFNGIIENEICPVYIARANSIPHSNSEEVEELRWMNWNDYVSALVSDGSNIYSYWCKDQLKQLRKNSHLLDYAQSR